MENGLLYILAFSAMAIALFATVLPQSVNLDLPFTETYSIETDGAYTWAVRYDGAKLWRSTNTSYTVNEAVSNLPSEGGKIFWSAGNYTITNPVNIGQNVRIEGESVLGTRIYLADGADCNMFQTLTPTKFFVTLEHIYANGNAAENTVGNITSFGAFAADILINDVFFENAAEYLVASESVWAYRITNNIFEYGKLGGVILNYGSDSRIMGNKFLYNFRGLIIASSHAIIEGNYFYKNDREAIKHDAGTGTTLIANDFVGNSFSLATGYLQLDIRGASYEITLIGNYFEGAIGSTKYPWNHMSLTTTGGNIPNNIIIEGNKFYNSSSAPIAFGSATVLVLRNNLGFVTENSFSSANTTATTAVVNHGCSGTLDYAWVSFSDSAITGYTWSSTSTQITVTPSGTLPASWTVYVKAEYVP